MVRQTSYTLLAVGPVRCIVIMYLVRDSPTMVWFSESRSNRRHKRSRHSHGGIIRHGTCWNPNSRLRVVAASPPRTFWPLP
ncbi:hypothetical protein B0I35DRAFT_121950 [Stachybotrys elegans]|uniref:Uncharacterized protein n=1 Tax=Stachybotrys elegans TaxID=80388 RepID=A0A8K0T0X8_9HYPO|nr:hypothetical protein B0I35DRAFT_121950 [Stachybotrys elegans]